MNSAGRFHIVLIVFLLTMLGYCCHVLLRPTFTIVSLTNGKNSKLYTQGTRTYMLDEYVPQVTEKALNNLYLDSVLKKEAIYKIITLDAFAPAHIDDCVKLSSVDKQDNFIHAALGLQVPHILEKFFKNTPSVLLLEFDQEALKNANLMIRKEQNKVDGTYFPHLYGTQKIPIVCVKTIIELIRNENKWAVNAISIIVPKTF